MSDVVTALQDDFKLFLQALWEQLDLPSPTRAHMQSQTIFNMDLNVFKFKLSVVLESLGSQEPSSSGLSLKILKRK